MGVPRDPLTFDHLAYKFRHLFYPLRFDHSPERLTELTGSTVLLITVLVQQKKDINLKRHVRGEVREDSKLETPLSSGMHYPLSILMCDSV